MGECRRWLNKIGIEFAAETQGGALAENGHSAKREVPNWNKNTDQEQKKCRNNETIVPPAAIKAQQRDDTTHGKILTKKENETHEDGDAPIST